MLHEFSHKLDMLDGTLDGTPPIDDAALRQRWVEVCTAEYQAVRAGAGGLSCGRTPGTNPGEFFAVATETFFTRPVAMQDAKPALYDVLAAPTARTRPRGAAAMRAMTDAARAVGLNCQRIRPDRAGSH